MRKQGLHPRTAILNKNQKNKSKKARLEALSWLAVNFPKAFDNSARISPLKIGIMQDILQYAEKAAQAGISISKLREAVVLFTRRLDYLACLKAREWRIDLEGVPVSEVTEEEAHHAAAKIKKRVEKGVRNARKILAEKISSQTTQSPLQPVKFIPKSISSPSPSAEDFLPVYPFRANAYNAQNTNTQPTRSAAEVVVKHKTTRQYDPSAVARLKEKLGLSRMEEKKETSE